MNRTPIEWVKNQGGSQGYSWNVFTGCKHGCEYCYARKIATRFQPDAKGREAIEQMCQFEKVNDVYILDDPVRINGKIQPFPFGFEPTFHRYRLLDPLKRKKPSTIFVCDMSDIMGEWFQSGWIRDIIAVMREAKQHTFLLLTKNPKRYFDFKFPENVWLGQSLDGKRIEHNGNFNDLFCRLRGMTEKSFVSFEPLIGDFSGIVWKAVSIIQNLDPAWVIVGAQTNPPRLSHKQHVIDILEHCQIFQKIPVFLKDNLQRFFPEQTLTQQIPYLGE